MGSPFWKWTPEEDTKLQDAVRNMAKIAGSQLLRMFPVERMLSVVAVGSKFWS
jgi:hypothetical protein